MKKSNNIRGIYFDVRMGIVLLYLPILFFSLTHECFFYGIAKVEYFDSFVYYIYIRYISMTLENNICTREKKIGLKYQNMRYHHFECCVSLYHSHYYTFIFKDVQ